MKTIDFVTGENFGAREGARLSYGNCSASALSWQVPCKGMAEPPPWAWMEPVEVCCAGERVFLGWVASCKMSLTAGGEYVWEIEVRDGFYLLDITPYSMREAWGAGAVGQFGSTTSHFGMLSADPPVSLAEAAGGTVKLHDVLRKLVPTVVLDCEDAVLLSFTASGMIGQIVRSVLGQLPWLSIWFGADGLLHVADDASRREVTVNVNRLKNLVLNERLDLVPPVVGIAWVASDVTMKLETWPRDADISVPGAVLVQVGAPTPGNDEKDDDEEKRDPLATSDYNYVKPQMPLLGDEVGTKDWWAKKCPLLAEVASVDELIFGAAKIEAVPQVTESKIYDAGATKYELVQGLLSEDLRGVKWGRTKVSATIISPVKPPPKFAGLFPTPVTYNNGATRWLGELSWEGVTTNRRMYFYRQAPEGFMDEGEVPFEEEDEDDEPVPDFGPLYADVLEEYYNYTRKAPMEGSFELLLGERASLRLHEWPIVGDKVNLHGGNPAWAALGASVEAVEVDLWAAVVKVSLGVAPHLGLQDSMERMQALREVAATTQENEKNGNEPDVVDKPQNWEMRSRKKSPAAGSIGPEGGLIPPQSKPEGDGWFVARAVVDTDGKPSGFEVKEGFVYNHKGGQETNSTDAKEGWVKFEEGAKAWCKVQVDNEGNITKAELTSGGGANNPAKVFDMGVTGRGKVIYDQGGTDAGNAAKANGEVTFGVASASGGQIVQQHVGGRFIETKHYVVSHEVWDKLNDPLNTNTPAPPSDKEVSLIAEKDPEKTKLQLLGEGKIIEILKGWTHNDTGEFLETPLCYLTPVFKKIKVVLNEKSDVVVVELEDVSDSSSASSTVKDLADYV